MLAGFRIRELKKDKIWNLNLIVLLSETKLYKGLREFGTKSSETLFSQWIIGVFN
jgi:hypothetical protein